MIVKNACFINKVKIFELHNSCYFKFVVLASNNLKINITKKFYLQILLCGLHILYLQLYAKKPIYLGIFFTSHQPCSIQPESMVS